MGKRLFANNASTALAASITAGATSCAATSGGGSLFPAITGGSGNTFQMTVMHIVSGVVTAFEIVTVTARATDTFTIVRAQEGTTALAWSAGDTIALLPTAAGFASFLQAADIQSGSENYSADTGVANAYVVGLTPALAAHVVGMPIIWKASNSNTGASTFSDGVGAAALETPAGAALSANMVEAAGIYLAFWNGTLFILANPDWAGFANAAAAAAQSAAQTYAAAQAAAAQAAAIASANTTSSNAGHLSSGTVPNAQLPNPAAGPGVTIAVDPGTTPSGAVGDIFYYY